MSVIGVCVSVTVSNTIKRCQMRALRLAVRVSINTALPCRCASLSAFERLQQAFGAAPAATDRQETADLSSPAAIVLKLQEALDATAQKLTTTMEPRAIQTSLILLLQQFAALKKQARPTRDGLFRGDTPAVAELEELAEALDFADMAYEDHVALREKLSGTGFTLLRHDTHAATETGRVAHFVAFSPARKVALVGLKGTSTVSDVLTDAIARSAPMRLAEGTFECSSSSGGGGDGGGSGMLASFMAAVRGRSVAGATHMMPKGGAITAHEGMLQAALTLADDTEHLVQELLVPAGYKVVVCGHSLGAGTACLLGLLLRSRLPELRSPSMLRVLAFATPPVLNYDAALACAPFTTSLVNNTDVIPRASVANLGVLLHMLQGLEDKLASKGIDINTNNPMQVARLAKLAASGEDGKLLMSPLEASDVMEDARAAVALRDPEHLFVPGRVLMMYEKGGDGAGGDFGCVEGDGAATMMRHIEMDRSMVTEHLCDSYKHNLKSVLGYT